jgi:hypothetical protein
MNKVNYICFYFFITLTFSFFSVSCKSRKTAVKTSVITNQVTVDTVDERCKLDYKSGKTLVKLMRQNELDFKTFSGKLNCELNSAEEENSFNISVRCRRDSAIWLNISKMGIDALRMLVTKDSVKFMIMTSLGGMEKGFFRGDFTYINQVLKAELDYDMLQSLLVGNSADFLNDSVKLRGGKDKDLCQYFLSTTRKKRLNRIIEGKTPKENLQAIWLSPGNWKVMTLEFIDVETNRKFIAGYNDFRTVGNFLVPFKHIYSISAEKNIKANMEWTKFNSNEPVTFPYKIPSSYDEIKINEKK